MFWDEFFHRRERGGYILVVVDVAFKLVAEGIGGKFHIHLFRLADAHQVVIFGHHG